eukprot:5827403-Pyramimonas_sp.AAC.1
MSQTFKTSLGSLYFGINRESSGREWGTGHREDPKNEVMLYFGIYAFGPTPFSRYPGRQHAGLVEPHYVAVIS